MQTGTIRTTSISFWQGHGLDGLDAIMLWNAGVLHGSGSVHVQGDVHKTAVGLVYQHLRKKLKPSPIYELRDRCASSCRALDISMSFWQR